MCSSEETEYWCGGCVAPLALALSEEDVRYHLIKAREGDGAFVVSRPCEKTITLPIEPQVCWLNCTDSAACCTCSLATRVVMSRLMTHTVDLLYTME